MIGKAENCLLLVKPKKRAKKSERGGRKEKARGC